MSYTLQKTGEKVQRETWRWEAHYTDGSVLRQFNDEDQSFHQFAEIDQTRLHVFRMVHDNALPFAMIFPTGAKLVHKYINAILNGGSPDEVRKRLYAFGYELDHRSFFLAISDGNVCVVTEDLDLIQVAA